MPRRGPSTLTGTSKQTATGILRLPRQTAIDPSDDRTIWYVGDYLREGATNYSTRIGAFRIGEGEP